jgi:tRNA nucleotidyltransferase/poly(A) polymerase
LKKYKPDDKFKRYFEKHISVIDRIHEYGYKAYFIGGCVRDAVMDRTPADFDIASDAEPDEIKKMFDKVKKPELHLVLCLTLLLFQKVCMMMSKEEISQ